MSAQAREKARQTACLSNTRQIGTAVQMYLQDYDDQLFIYVNTVRPSQSRTGAVIPSSQKNALRWWNLVLPYLNNTGPGERGEGRWACPRPHFHYAP